MVKIIFVEEQMKRALLAAAAVLLGSGLMFSAMDSSYVSYEKKDAKGSTIYMRFRLNIPYAIKYVEGQVKWLDGKIKTETSPRKLKSYQKSKGNYEIMLSVMKNPKNSIKAIYVFGDFNAWMTAGSDKPNRLEPTSSNADTWYTKTYVPFIVTAPGEQLRYKFVIDYGVVFKAQDGTDQEYVYIEDPRNSNKGPDGFGGYNSFFLSE